MGNSAPKQILKLLLTIPSSKTNHCNYLEESIYPQAGASPDPTFVENDFSVLYDNLHLLKFNAEIYHTATDRLNLLLSANFYAYEMETQMEAWNMPQFDAKIALSYTVTDQLEVTTDLFVIGEKKKGWLLKPTNLTPPSQLTQPPLAVPFTKHITLTLPLT